MCIQGSSLYLVGGHSDGLVLRKMYKYDFTHEKWDIMHDMNEQRVYFNLVAIPDFGLIALGGYDGEKVLKSCEIYKADKDTWEMLDDMHQRRMYSAATLIPNSYLGSQICVLGGIDDQEKVLSSVEVLCLETSEWKVVLDDEDKEGTKIFNHNVVNV